MFEKREKAFKTLIIYNLSNRIYDAQENKQNTTTTKRDNIKKGIEKKTVFKSFKVQNNVTIKG